MLNALRPFPLGAHSLDLIADFHRDLRLWSNSVGDFNEISIIREIHWSDPDTDASSWGMGCYASGNYVHGEKNATHAISPHLSSAAHGNYYRSSFMEGGGCCPHYSGNRLIAQCDNMCVVNVIAEESGLVRRSPNIIKYRLIPH